MNWDTGSDVQILADTFKNCDLSYRLFKNYPVQLALFLRAAGTEMHVHIVFLVQFISVPKHFV